VATGRVLVAVYLVVAAATLALAGRHVLPLFEGFKPPEPYQWVEPPPPYAPGNQVPPPVSVTQDINAALSVTTDDSQCTISLASGSIGQPQGDARVLARLTPLAAHPGALPGGLHAAGNAYRVELVGQPSAKQVIRLDAPGHLVLKGAIPVQAVLYSTDGRAWVRLPSQRVGDPTVAGALFSRTGMYLVASRADPASVSSRATGRTGTWAVALAVVGLAAALLLVPDWSRRVGGKA
jgi:hypothetical protein